MQTQLKYIGQHALDLFYQAFKPAAGFWDIDDAIYFAGVSYAGLLSQEYDIERQRLMKDGEETIVTFSHDWLQTQDLEIEKDEDFGWSAKLDKPIMSFPFDKRDVGLQNIFPKGFKSEFIRSSIDSIWQNELLPLTKNTYWALLKDKIILFNNSKQEFLKKKIKVVYVSAIHEDMEIPQTRHKMIIDATILLMRNSEKDKVVKKLNSGNENAVLQEEADQNGIKK